MAAILPGLELIASWFSQALLNFKNLPTQSVQAEVKLPEITTYINIGSGELSEGPGPRQVKIGPTVIPAELKIPVIPVNEVSHKTNNALTTIMLLLAVAYLGLRIAVELGLVFR